MLHENTSNNTVPLQKIVDRFLLKYRTTPGSTNRVSPNDLIFKRKTKTLLDDVNPRIKENNIQNRNIYKPTSTAVFRHKINLYVKEYFPT